MEPGLIEMGGVVGNLEHALTDAHMAAAVIDGAHRSQAERIVALITEALADARRLEAARELPSLLRQRDEAEAAVARAMESAGVAA